MGEKSRAKIVLSNKGVLSTEYVLYKYPMNSSIIPLFSGSEVETAPKNNTKGDHGKPSIASVSMIFPVLLLLGVINNFFQYIYTAYKVLIVLILTIDR